MLSSLMSINMTKNDEVKSIRNDECIEILNVRITPGKIIFEDAWAGRKYKKEIMIQNFGDRIVYVTIFTPTSLTFEINKLVRQLPLPPGLRITRKIFYTHNPVAFNTLYGAKIPIIVNEHRVDYSLEVTLSSARISAIPSLLDFGILDIASSTVVRKLVLRNSGSKSSHFAIDLTKNRQLIIEPKKGFLKPQEEIELTVELICLYEGSFAQDVWVKAEKLFSFCVVWNARRPYLEAIQQNATADFTLIDFPRTYFGTKIFQSMVIRNISSGKLIYAIGVIVEQNIYSINEGRRISEDLRQFHISPLDGRMSPMEGRLLQFMFAPVREKRETREHFEKFYFCYLKIIPLHFQDLYTPVFKAETKTSKAESKYGNDNTSLTFSLESASTISVTDSISLSLSSIKNNRVINVYLHGEVETPNVTVLPTEFELIDLIRDEEVHRVLLITNKSMHLSITLQYEKVPFVFIRPSIFQIEANSSVEILITFKPAKFGTVNSKITFTLLYKSKSDQFYYNLGLIDVHVKMVVPSVTTYNKPEFNMGITPKCTNEVGFLTDDVRFNTNVEKPQAAMVGYKTTSKDNALIAFPNDRQQSLKPWKNDVECRTIFAGIPRHKAICDENYELTQIEIEKKIDNNTYFEQFLKREALKFKKNPPKIGIDYLLTDRKELLLKNHQCDQLQQIALREKARYADFIALTTMQLMMIEIKPKRIKLGQVARLSTVQGSIYISNQTAIPIRVFLVALPLIEFRGGNRRFLKGLVSMHIKFVYNGKSNGIFDTIIQIIVNESHVFEVSVSGEVVPQTIQIDQKTILFDDPNELYKQIDLYNAFNSYTIFRWEVPTSCFDIEPATGYVPPKGHIISEISYHPERDGSKLVDVNLLANFNLNHIVKLMGGDLQTKVSLNSYCVEFENVPLNILTKKRIGLINEGLISVVFEIVDSVPINGIEITPTNGILKPKDIVYLEISIKLEMMINFDFTIHINLKRHQLLSFQLIGNVVYPEIDIEPRTLNFRKIYEHAYDLMTFKMKNVSKAMVEIDFGIANLKEFNIFRSIDNPVNIDTLSLKPDESIVLYIEYTALYISTLSFFLPMVINGLIGPPDVCFIQTQRNNFFLTPLNEHMSNVNVLLCPESLPTIKIFSYIRKQAITFTHFHMEFSYYPYGDYESVTEMLNVIYNPTKDDVEFILRIDDVRPPFSVIYDDGVNVEINELSISAILPSKSYVTFKFEFKPTTPGEYRCKLPVYVRNYLEDSVYNYLTCYGIYHPPTISGLTDVVYLESVFLGVHIEYDFPLTLSYHTPNCKINFISDVEELTASFPDGPFFKSENCINVKNVVICFTASKKMGLDTVAKFECKCGAYFEVMVKGSCDNCMITNHAFLYLSCYSSNTQINLNKVPSLNYSGDESMISFQAKPTAYDQITHKNGNGFPYFPADDVDLPYALYMHKILKVVESWVYTQGFFQKKFYLVPEDIREVIVSEKAGITTPYFELLTNLGGKKLKKNENGKSSTNQIEALSQIDYLYQNYQQVIQMLTDYGAVLSHVEPQYLMPYNDYVTYMKTYNTNPLNTYLNEELTILDEVQFLHLSKQIWIDFLLQTYKVFVHDRPALSEDTEYEIMASYCTKTQVILDWLESLIKTSACNLWSSRIYYINLKFARVELLTKDLKDSYVFACITYYYCPYLKNYFQNFHFDNSSETLYYNALKIIDAWKSINVSFQITAKDITSPNIIEMIFLVNYLYEFLPSLEIKDVIKLESNLTEKYDKSIYLDNLNPYPIKFTLTFFENDRDCFSVNHDELIIPAHKSKEIIITYFAKKMEIQTCYLYICGETPYYHYGKSKVMKLIGIPNLNFYNEEKFIKIPIYLRKECNIEVKSPYREQCDYKILITEKEPTPTTLSTHEWYEIKPSLYPKRVNLITTTLTCDDNGFGITRFYTTAFTPFIRTFYFYYKNETVGDFCYKITTIVKKSEQFEILAYNISESFNTFHCICQKDTINTDCPKLIKFMIPSRHKFLFDNFMETFVAYLGNPADPFWKKYAKSNICAHMMEKLRSSTPYVSSDIDHVFAKDTLYKVMTKVKNVTLDPTILINDVKSLDLKPLRCHINYNGYPNNFNMTLVSQDGRDIRNYYVQFPIQAMKSASSLRRNVSVKLFKTDKSQETL